MKKLLILIVLILFSIFIFGCEKKTTNIDFCLDEIDGEIDTWSVPKMKKNETYKVYVSSDNIDWEEIEVYNVHSGHQLGDQLLRYTGATFFGEPNNNSLCMFDFNGTIGVKIVFKS